MISCSTTLVWTNRHLFFRTIFRNPLTIGDDKLKISSEFGANKQAIDEVKRNVK